MKAVNHGVSIRSSVYRHQLGAAELTIRIGPLGICKFNMPSRQDVRECKLLRQNEVIAVLVQASTQDWDVDGHEDGFVSHAYPNLAF